MLPADYRLRRSADFTAVMRSGQRAARSTLVVHVLVDPSVSSIPSTVPSTTDRGVSRFGLVVGRTVGNSVVRHRVSRRLRGVLATRLAQVPPGTDVVVRARPEAAAADSRQLGADIDGALASVARRRARAAGSG